MIDTELVGQMTIVSDWKRTFMETIVSYFRKRPIQSIPASMRASSHSPAVHQADSEEIRRLHNIIGQQEAQLQQIKAELSRVTRANEDILRHCSDVQSDRNKWEATARRFHDMVTEERTAKENAVSSSNTLKERYSIVRDELAEVRQELQGSRNFGSAETSDDGKTLTNAFNDLNSLVDELCFAMAELLPETLLETPFCGLQAKHPTLESLQAFFESAKNEGVLTPDVVQYTLQHVILVHLFEVVFRPFTPGLDATASDSLHRLYAGISQQHPQTYSARWRSITYGEIGSRIIDFASTGRTLIEDLLSLVPLLCPQNSISAMVPTEGLLHKATDIISAASAWQDKAKSSYTSWDYEVFVVLPGYPFDTKEMQFGVEPARKSRKTKTGVTPSGDVVATLRLGLRAWRSVQQGGTYAKETKTPVPAAVLTPNWTSFIND